MFFRFLLLYPICCSFLLLLVIQPVNYNLRCRSIFILCYQQHLFFNFLLKINGMREINFQIEKEKEDSEKVYARSEIIESGINEIKKLGSCLLGKKENTAKFFLKFWESLPTKASLYGIEIDNRCSHCRVCILLCTNQALEAKEKVEQTGFCNGCGLCIEICPQKAIILKKIIFRNISTFPFLFWVILCYNNHI